MSGMETKIVVVDGADGLTPDMLRVRPENVEPPERHNHITRDIKPLGQCPVCDRYHNRTPESVETPLAQASRLVSEQQDATPENVESPKNPRTMKAVYRCVECGQVLPCDCTPENVEQPILPTPKGCWGHDAYPTPPENVDSPTDYWQDPMHE